MDGGTRKTTAEGRREPNAETFAHLVTTSMVVSRCKCCGLDELLFGRITLLSFEGPVRSIFYIYRYHLILMVIFILISISTFIFIINVICVCIFRCLGPSFLSPDVSLYLYHCCHLFLSIHLHLCCSILMLIFCSTQLLSQAPSRHALLLSGVRLKYAFSHFSHVCHLVSQSQWHPRREQGPSCLLPLYCTASVEELKQPSIWRQQRWRKCLKVQRRT